jgi:antitoxin component YwqK of YwqJK toxin-antitoxin module
MRLINCIFLIVISVFGSCKKQIAESTSNFLAQEITNILIDKEQVKLAPLKGKWLYKQQPFNGYSVSYHENDCLLEKIGFFNGKREGKAFKYFKDGSLKNEMNYIQNRLHGTKYNYFKNGNVYSESNYENGKRHGIQKIWFLNGQLARKKNLKEGKEEGLQQAWRGNGTLYVNYEAKNGRIFGLNRANLCYALKNEKVQYAKKK